MVSCNAAQIHSNHLQIPIFVYLPRASSHSPVFCVAPKHTLKTHTLTHLEKKNGAETNFWHCVRVNCRRPCCLRAHIFTSHLIPSKSNGMCACARLKNQNTTDNGTEQTGIFIWWCWLFSKLTDNEKCVDIFWLIYVECCSLHIWRQQCSSILNSWCAIFHKHAVATRVDALLRLCAFRRY